MRYEDRENDTMVVNDQLDHPHGCNEVNEGLCSDVRMNFTKLARRHIGAIIATIVHAIMPVKYYKVSFHVPFRTKTCKFKTNEEEVILLFFFFFTNENQKIRSGTKEN